MNPIEILFCWQALIIAVFASCTTQVTKRSVDILRGRQLDADGHLDLWEYMGKELRAHDVFMNNLILPGLVVFYGAVGATALPIRPEALIDYCATHAPGAQAYLVYAGWGAACGQFADWIFMRVKSTISDIGKSNPNAG